MLSRLLLPVERRIVRLCRDELAELSLVDGDVADDNIQTARALAANYLAADPEGQLLGGDDADAVLDAAIDDLFFLGPLEDLLADPAITDIQVNAPDSVWVEANGKLMRTAVCFEDDAHVKAIIDRICGYTGRRCDEGHPLCDCVLDRPGMAGHGARVNAVCTPIAVDHHLLCIRKYKEGTVDPSWLMGTGMFDQRALELLEAFVVGRANILISGGTGTGKTTLLSAMTSWIPMDQRIGVLEDTKEIAIPREAERNVYRGQARQANAEGSGEVTIQSLVINSLRQRPDRIIVGECRGPEGYDMLRAISSGHIGSITTVHADDPRGALIALRTMVQQAGYEMGSRDILDYVCRCFDIVVSVERGFDGRRRITEIAEVCGMEGDTPRLSTILRFEQDPWEGGEITGSHVPTGERISPRLEARMAKNGVEVSDWWYGL